MTDSHPVRSDARDDSAADSAVGASVVPALVTQRHGGALLRGGRKGNRGGGRTPDEFKARLAELVGSDDVVREIERILTDRNHPHFMRALEWATDRAHGKLPNRIEGDVRAVTGVILLPEPSWGAPQPQDRTPGSKIDGGGAADGDPIAFK
jgi:hypothetical protein